MLQLSDFLVNRQVLSLRAGSPVAIAQQPIINPNNLTVEGFYCVELAEKKPLILLCQDIREILRDGFVVDDVERLVETNDLVRLKDVIELRFELIGKPVVTVDKEKVGKISDYAVETNTMSIQKLYAAQSILRNFTGGSLSIDRNQVQEITPRRIVISELLKGTPATAPTVA
ncbi:hypothetical protein KDA23_03505 [Candidatus Saccharibacteria bacterium]|nr:hypothetical protein [Candidatus Saccharibacteria bacterium]